MSYLKYYARENERHQVAEKVTGNLLAIITMTKILCKHFRVPVVKVKLFDKQKKQFKRKRKTQSWYHGGSKPEIVYHPTMLSALTVAHEVAHHVDAVRCRVSKISRGRAHSAAHRALTDQGVEALKSHPTFKRFFESGMGGTIARDGLALDNLFNVPAGALRGEVVRLGGTVPIPGFEKPTSFAQAVQRFYTSLPVTLTCPCCKAELPKLNFGVRVMKKDASGMPVVMRRQSYCRGCR